MFGRVIFVVTLGVAAALFGSFSLLDRLPARAPVAAAEPAPPSPPARSGRCSRPPRPRPPSANRPVIARPRCKLTDAVNTRLASLVNGVPVQMLVDTGASDVVVSASTAARLGLVPSRGSKRVMQTANGRSTASTDDLAKPQP